ncbi:MAG: PilN domain-containing protein [Thermoleophilia bacterium]|jgi:Tfp pilus assembly protein PilN
MKRRINLVPLSERTRTATDINLLLMIALVIVVVFAIGFGYFALDIRLENKERELTELQQQAALIESQTATLRQYELVQQQAAKAESVVTEIYGAQISVSDLLNDISLVVPDSVWFQNVKLTVADPVVLKTGTGAQDEQTSIVFEASTRTFESVAQLIVRLRLVPSLTDVKLVGVTDQEDQGTKSFSVMATVVDTTPEAKLPLRQSEVSTP